MTRAHDIAPTLPIGFEDFEPYVAFGLPTQSARNEKKMQSTMEELVELYNLGIGDGRVLDALRYCDQFELRDLPDDARRLFFITLSIAELRPQVELYKSLEVPSHAAHPSRMRMTPESDRL